MISPGQHLGRTVDFQVELVGTREAAAAFRHLGIVAQEATRLGLKAGGEIIREAAVENLRDRPLWQSGTLARSLHVEETPGRPKSNPSVDIGTDLEYAAIHEFGGTIVPKNAPALVFEIDGELIFAKSVEIPARPYLHPALDNKGGIAIRETGKVIGHILEGLNR